MHKLCSSMKVVQNSFVWLSILWEKVTVDIWPIQMSNPGTSENHQYLTAWHYPITRCKVAVQRSFSRDVPSDQVIRWNSLSEGIRMWFWKAPNNYEHHQQLGRSGLGDPLAQKWMIVTVMLYAAKGWLLRQKVVNSIASQALESPPTSKMGHPHVWDGPLHLLHLLIFVYFLKKAL
jgi:hypothetical protein